MTALVKPSQPWGRRPLARIAASLLLLLFCWAGAMRADEAAPEYTKTVTTLHMSARGAILANVMPGTQVTVRSESGGFQQVDITGWSPAGGAAYLFKDIGQRITYAMLSKPGINHRVVVGTKDDDWGGTWEQVTVTGWIDRNDLTDNLDEVWADADKLYETHCSRCHSLRRPEEFTANQWPPVLKIMTKRAGFSADQAALVTMLLQFHAKDQGLTDAFTRSEGKAAAQAATAATEEIVGTPELEAKGAALFVSANCAACHGDNAKTPAVPSYPSLAGQTAQYLLKQLGDFQTGARTNDPDSVMRDGVAQLSTVDLTALAYWLSLQ